MPLPFLLKKIVTALILPPTSLVLLALLGLWLSKKRPKAGRTLAAVSLIMLLILSLPVTGNALLCSLETQPPISKIQLEQTQAIVILGGGKNGHAQEFGDQDTVSRWTLQRLRYGAYLQRQSHQPILVSGGAPFGGRPEADTMAESLEQDFHAKDILVEDQSKDTAENAEFSARILKQRGITHIALVSQAWHLTRATRLFEQQGLTVTPAPTGYTTEDDDSILRWLPKASALEKSAIALKEYLGRLTITRQP
jgi:uncharacterized SAM-binding protein YcdF (DUF218 family)